jgi:hypothetical protein
MRKASCTLAIALTGVALCIVPSAADHAPTVVVPSAPGVPIVVYGQDLSWAVVEGDWGLYRAGHGERTVTYGAPVFLRPPPGAFYPSAGRRPRLGRHEVAPASVRKGPAPTYYRMWSVESAPGPATVYPPYEPPSVTIDRGLRHRY